MPASDAGGSSLKGFGLRNSTSGDSNSETKANQSFISPIATRLAPIRPNWSVARSSRMLRYKMQGLASVSSIRVASKRNATSTASHPVFLRRFVSTYLHLPYKRRSASTGHSGDLVRPIIDPAVDKRRGGSSSSPSATRAASNAITGRSGVYLNPV